MTKGLLIQVVTRTGFTVVHYWTSKKMTTSLNKGQNGRSPRCSFYSKAPLHVTHAGNATVSTISKSVMRMSLRGLGAMLPIYPRRKKHNFRRCYCMAIASSQAGQALAWPLLIVHCNSHIPVQYNRGSTAELQASIVKCYMPALLAWLLDVCLLQPCIGSVCSIYFIGVSWRSWEMPSTTDSGSSSSNLWWPWVRMLATCYIVDSIITLCVPKDCWQLQPKLWNLLLFKFISVT